LESNQIKFCQLTVIEPELVQKWVVLANQKLVFEMKRFQPAKKGVNVYSLIFERKIFVKMLKCAI
jgi:hypothetical protein